MSVSSKRFVVLQFTFPELTMSRISLLLFSSELEMRTASLLHLPTPSVPSQLDALVDSSTNAMNLCTKEALVSTPLHRRLVPF